VTKVRVRKKTSDLNNNTKSKERKGSPVKSQKSNERNGHVDHKGRQGYENPAQDGGRLSNHTKKGNLTKEREFREKEKKISKKKPPQKESRENSTGNGSL